MILSFDQPPDFERLIPRRLVDSLPTDQPLDELPWKPAAGYVPPTKAVSALGEIVERDLVPTATAVVGYHACRISNERSYLDRGIQRAGYRDSVAEVAAANGVSIARLQTTIQMLDSAYLHHTHEHVFLLHSRKYSLKTKFGLHHAAGSETLRIALKTLGVVTPILQGRPALIACTVPVEVVGEKMTNLLARGLVLHWLATHHHLNVGSEPREGGIRVAADIQPEWIQIEYLSDSIL
jgi:hypothetical protein